MNLLEYQGLQLFAKSEIPHPRAFLLTTANSKEWETLCKKIRSDKIVLKAQIPTGKRGKHGGILIIPHSKVSFATKRLLAKKIRNERVYAVLAEEYITHEQEWYLGIAVDRRQRALRLIFSEKGGMDIEEVALKSPGAIKTVVLSAWNTKKISSLFSKRRKELTSLAKKLWECAHVNEATLVEVNPLLVQQKRIIAGDAKVVLDDNALYRHEELKAFNIENKDAREEKAKVLGLHYVELDGNIGIVGCGAGMVMATLDLVAYYGGMPANFLDVGGGASRENMSQALSILTSNPSLRGVFINIFGGITKCDEIAQGIVDFRHKNRMKYPIVVRMIGTREKEGKEILLKNAIHSLDSMESGAKKIVQLVKR